MRILCQNTSGGCRFAGIYAISYVIFILCKICKILCLNEVCRGTNHTISDRESVLVVDLQEAKPQTDISAVPLLVPLVQLVWVQVQV